MSALRAPVPAGGEGSAAARRRGVRLPHEEALDAVNTVRSATATALGAASPARVYARTQPGTQPPRFFVLNLDPSPFLAVSPVVNRLDVDGDGTLPDVTVQITPKVVAGCVQVSGAVIRIARANANATIRDLRIDIGARLDAAITPPTGAPTRRPPPGTPNAGSPSGRDSVAFDLRVVDLINHADDPTGFSPARACENLAWWRYTGA